MISQKSIQEVLNISQVDELIQEYVTLKRRGVNMIGLCPFHDEKTPSFTVSPGKNIYKCFGCGQGGGPVQFLMEHDQLSFPEAIRSLAARYNITLEEDSKEETEKFAEQKKVEESYYIINDFALDYYTNNLYNTENGKLIGLSYFKERGFLESTLEKFQLGFSLNESKGLVTKALQKQFKEEFLKDIGLMSQKGYDFFRNRVMFPIHNVSGKVIAFAGRTLSTDKKQPKYINSPETPIYNKRRILYGLHLAKGVIRKKDNCIIVEGYTDVISLHQNGVENVVASSGTSLTSGQVRLVKRYTDNVTFLYDGDKAGVKAAMRGLDIVLENGMNVSLVLLPDGEDPDSFVKANGNAKFEEYVKQNAKDFIFFKMDLLLADSGNDPIKKAGVIKDILGSVAKLMDPIKRSLYVRQCSQVLEVDEAILVKEVNKLIRGQIKQKQLDQAREARQAERKASQGSNSAGRGFGQAPPSRFDGGYGNGRPSGPALPVGPQSDAPFPDSPFPGGGGINSGAPFPNEEFNPGDYDEYDHYPEEKVEHNQLPTLTFINKNDEYQERDLARIVIESGDKIIKDEDEGEMLVAELVYANIYDVFEFFDNAVCKKIIEEGYNYLEIDGVKMGITDYFINHKDPEIAQFAVDAISSPYEFASWNNLGVYLNQLMPEENFKNESKQSVLRFKFRKLNKVIGDLQKRIMSEEMTEERKEQLLKVFRKLQLQKVDLSKELGVVIIP